MMSCMKASDLQPDGRNRTIRAARTVHGVGVGCIGGGVCGATIDRDPCAGDAQPHESEDLARDDILC